jgi:alcohol dehydrogenase (NADP+)
VETALNQTLTDLNLSYLDLYLMHWPVGESLDSKTHPYDFVQTWSSMEKLLTTGRVRNIGVSNFSPAQMTELIKKSGVKPAAHQMELHPYLPQTEWVNWHKTHGISLTAYSPLGNMNPTYGDKSRRAGVTASKVPLLLDNEVVRDIAEKRDCTAAQVVLAWGMKRGVSVIPKSKHEMFIKQNIGAVECMLEGEDVVRMDGLEGKPVRFNNPSKGWGVDLFEGLEDA